MTSKDTRSVHMPDDSCAPKLYYYLCESVSTDGFKRQNKGNTHPEHRSNQDKISLSNVSIFSHTYFHLSVTCPENHVVPGFLACDLHSKCWAKDGVSFQPSTDALTALTSSWCSAPNTFDSLYFLCSTEGERLPFTLVCDYRRDCFDGSDEDFCVHPPCGGERLMACGDSGQCIRETDWCSESNVGCRNSADSRLCDYVVQFETTLVKFYKLWEKEYIFPSVVQFNMKQAGASYYHLTPGSMNPPTHFQCPSLSLHLPVFVRCNGVYDCPNKEDEADCETYSCPGYFRCRQSRVCLHPDHVCDGVNHCPQQDDEWYCSLSCPHQCSCQGLAFTCRHAFPVEEFPDIRYLYVSGSEMKAESLFMNNMLIYLNMTGCILNKLFLPQLPNLKILDVSDNQLQILSLEILQNVRNLNYLVMANNPLTSLFPGGSNETHSFPSLRILDLTLVKIAELNLSRLQPFPGLVVLNLSGSRTRIVSGERFDNPVLTKLDLCGSEIMDFPHRMLKSLNKLERLSVDNFELCCEHMLPTNMTTKNCHGPSLILSTCDRLLGHHSQRFVIYFLVLFMCAGNCALVVLFSRNNDGKDVDKTPVSHLCGSKYLMSIYLIVLCAVDHVFSGSYLWEDKQWRFGVLCKVLSFVFLLSCEVAVFVDVSLTLNNCALLSWPDRLRGKRGRNIVSGICLLAWLFGVCLSLVPVVSTDIEFSQTSLCIPLPVSGDQPGGHHYAFSLLVVVNSALMVLAVTGQTYVHILIHSNTVAVLLHEDKARHFNAARRVICVIFMDACCWGLVTLWAVLISHNVWVPGDFLYSASFFFVLIGAALTPYLYLLNVMLERRRQMRKQRILQRLRFQVKAGSKEK